MNLNKNINKFFENRKKRIPNEVILGTVEKFNPYFSVKDPIDKERYKNNRETYIFDYINFRNISDTFIKNFQNLNFETMFEENIGDYINKITGKIDSIQTFGNITKLVNIEKIEEDKQKEYFRILEEKYKFVIKDNIKLIKSEIELNKGIKIIAEFISKIFLFENKNRFLDEEISLLENNIKSRIYLELIATYNEEKYKDQKNRIYEIYLEKRYTKEGRKNIIELRRKLKPEDKKYFIYEKLLQKCDFKKEDFFSNQENYNIQTLCLLNKELIAESQKEDEKKEEEEEKKEKDKNKEFLKQIQKGNKYAENLVIILDDIRDDLEKGRIIKKDLETFLNIKSKKNEVNTTEKTQNKKDKNKDENMSKQISDEIDPYVMDKLELITLTTENYDPIAKYAEYRRNIYNINKNVEELEFIKDSLMIFHRNLYFGKINEITNTLSEIENYPIQKFRSDETKNCIKNLLTHKTLCLEVRKVKDLLLFQKIFENALGDNQAERFDNANKKLKELKSLFAENPINIEKILNHENYKDIFNQIKNELGNKPEIQSKTFMDQIINYFEIKDKKVIKELKIIINSKKYENIVKSIKYFFDNFSYKKITLLENMNLNLSEINSLSNLQKILNQLKRDEIFDYGSNSQCYSIFTAFYEKKEAIDFLLSKLNTYKSNKDFTEFENKLQNNLDVTTRSISTEDIKDTIGCLEKFKYILEYDIKDIIKYVLNLPIEITKKFESFSKKYGSLIELDRKKGEDNFKEVYDIIEDASLLFNLDGEDFCYKINGEAKYINSEKLIKLKNKINIQQKKHIKENGDKIPERPEEKKRKIFSN